MKKSLLGCRQGKTGSRGTTLEVTVTVLARGNSGLGEGRDGDSGPDRSGKICFDLQVESEGVANMWKG